MIDFRDLLECVNENGRRHVITLHRSLGVNEDEEVPVDVRHIASLTVSARHCRIVRRPDLAWGSFVSLCRGTDITIRYGDVVSVDEPVEEVTRQISMAEFAMGVDDL